MKILLLALALIAPQAHAVEGDLVLPDAPLITADFEENGQACRYSALLQRGARSTLNLKESKAFSADAGTTCEAGKAVIDTLVTKMSFSVTKPINFLGLRVPAVDTAVCGEDARGIKIVFACDRSVNLKNQQQ